MEDKKIDGFLKNISKPQKGSIITGKIINISSEGVFVDIGWKTEALIDIEEFMKKDGDIQIQIGQEIPVFVKNFSNEKITLSYREAKRRILLKEIEDSFNYNIPLEVYVREKIRGGFSVIYSNELEGFLPFSEIYDKGSNPVGKILKTKVIKFEKERENFVVSEKKFKEMELKKIRDEFFKNTKVGDTVKAKVKSIIQSGVFVDINGIEGFIHKENISWGRIERISDYLKIGEILDAKVLRIDRERNRISLGLKQLQPHPWENVNEKFRKGQIVLGKVVEVYPERAIFEIDKGIEGILKKEDFSWKKIFNLKKHLKKFDKLKVFIKNIDEKKRKMILSLKEFEKNPYSKYKNNEIVKGTVFRIERNFCDIELEKGIFGRLFIKQASNKKLKSLTEMFKKGDTVTAKIINVEPEKGIIELSVREYLKDKEKEEIEKYTSKSNVEFTIKELLED